MDLVKGIYTVFVTDAVNQVVNVEVPINEFDPIVETETPVIETIIYFVLTQVIIIQKTKLR